jgi:hypothetical protein
MLMFSWVDTYRFTGTNMLSSLAAEGRILERQVCATSELGLFSSFGLKITCQHTTIVTYMSSTLPI